MNTRTHTNTDVTQRIGMCRMLLATTTTSNNAPSCAKCFASCLRLVRWATMVAVLGKRTEVGVSVHGESCVFVPTRTWAWIWHAMVDLKYRSYNALYCSARVRFLASICECFPIFEKVSRNKVVRWIMGSRKDSVILFLICSYYRAEYFLPIEFWPQLCTYSWD